MDGYPQDERLLMHQCIMEVRENLDHFKQKVKYIKDYQGQIEKSDPSLQHKFDSLKVDYLEGKLKLESSLRQFKEYNIP